MAKTKPKSEPKRKSFVARTIKYDDWTAEAKQRFGEDKMQWRFVCPVCRHVAAVKDWMDAGAPEGTVAFSCVGRYISGAKDAFSGSEGRPCNYAGGGLFKLNPVTVEADVDGKAVTFDAFEFDGAQPEAQAPRSEQ